MARRTVGSGGRQVKARQVGGTGAGPIGHGRAGRADRPRLSGLGRRRRRGPVLFPVKRPGAAIDAAPDACDPAGIARSPPRPAGRLLRRSIAARIKIASAATIRIASVVLLSREPVRWGRDELSGSLLSYVALEARVRGDHPLANDSGHSARSAFGIGRRVCSAPSASIGSPPASSGTLASCHVAARLSRASAPSVSGWR